MTFITEKADRMPYNININNKKGCTSLKTLGRAKRKAQQAVALYEQHVINNSPSIEIRNAYKLAQEMVDYYGMELDLESDTTENPVDYTDYYDLRARLDMNIEQYRSYFN